MSVSSTRDNHIEFRSNVRGQGADPEVNYGSRTTAQDGIFLSGKGRGDTSSVRVRTFVCRFDWLDLTVSLCLSRSEKKVVTLSERYWSFQ